MPGQTTETTIECAHRTEDDDVNTGDDNEEGPKRNDNIVILFNRFHYAIYVLVRRGHRHSLLRSALASYLLYNDSRVVGIRTYMSFSCLHSFKYKLFRSV